MLSSFVKDVVSGICSRGGGVVVGSIYNLQVITPGTFNFITLLSKCVSGGKHQSATIMLQAQEN